MHLLQPKKQGCNSYNYNILIPPLNPFPSRFNDQKDRHCKHTHTVVVVVVVVLVVAVAVAVVVVVVVVVAVVGRGE